MNVLHRENITSQHIVVLLYYLVSFQLHAELSTSLLLSNILTFFIRIIFGNIGGHSNGMTRNTVT